MEAETLILVHHGTEMSFDLFLHADGRTVTVSFRDGRRCQFRAAGEGDWVDFIMPSVGGELLVCCLGSGRNVLFGSGDGRELSADADEAKAGRFYD